MKNFKELMVEELMVEDNKKAAIRSQVAKPGGGSKNINQLKDRYYGVGDNMDELVNELITLDKNSGGEFADDVKAAKAALKAFRKLSLGKYL